FQITGSGSLSAVRLTGTNALACTGTIDLTQTPGVDDIAYTIAQTSTSQTVTVTLGSAASLSTTTAVSVFMMILPGTQSGDITIELEIGGSWKSMTKTPPAGGFVRGKKYNIAVLHDSRDGNLYSYKTIGTQVWMTENLAYLPSVVGPGTGSNSTAYYYVYGYDGTDVDAAKATSNYTTYGVLYNWPAAMSGAASSSADPSGVQGICPTGWHLPSDAEWTTLTTYLGGESVAGGKMKEAGESHWTSPNTGATNESGFTALPGGYRSSNGNFTNIGIDGYWWSSTEDSAIYAWSRYLYYDLGLVGSFSGDKDYGFSVRCLRD
ncbi:MAG TPA: fibrobacter succinogenes major paralogous domain-containing protein, partial [Bacteroidales bacterium]|nr:fibrobacter succinogenes major paralogous domain-containing protein [Bacteroidales bacterium]